VGLRGPGAYGLLQRPWAREPRSNHQLRCRQCRRLFESKRSDAVFCSSACRKRASRNELGPYRRYELLTGKVRYPVKTYSGYGDGIGPDVDIFISDKMRNDWLTHRDELMAFWRSGKSACKVFPDSKPWLDVRGDADTLPWAAEMFDKEAG
jgi:hypothetical protein